MRRSIFWKTIGYVFVALWMIFSIAIFAYYMSMIPFPETPTFFQVLSCVFGLIAWAFITVLPFIFVIK